MPKPHSAIILGSNRALRFADKPAAWLKEKAQARDDMTFDVLDLRDQNLPFFDEPASNLWILSQDPQAGAWEEQLAKFDGFVFLTSEHNRSITGAQRNALDQAYQEWVRKPMAAMGYGGVGASRAMTARAQS
ncbi:NAD(P)H-dependent FMN reductase [Roseovarius sp. MBR-51]